MSQPLRIGVVGFSQRHFDHDAARTHLRRLVTACLVEGRAAEIVSGLTSQGLPQLAYELATELGLATVGISANQALRARAGCYPVTRRILVGERYGDESNCFVAYCDVLIRIGGGPQSRREVELFRAKFGDDPGEIGVRLFEVEVDWYGDERDGIVGPRPATSGGTRASHRRAASRSSAPP